MADTPTTSGKYRKQGLGDRSAAWGLSSGLNGVLDVLDEAVHGVNVVSLATTNYTLTSTNYTSNEVRQRFHRFTDGGISAQATITVPASENWWIMSNAVTGYSVVVSNGANSITLSDGETAIVATDGTNVYKFGFTSTYSAPDPGANGIVVRTSEGVTTARTLQAVSNELAMTNGSGISGNPTIGLASAINFAGKTLTGGNIDNTRIGANTRNDAFFTDVTVTTVTASTQFVVGSAVLIEDQLQFSSAAAFRINASAAGSSIVLRVAGNDRVTATAAGNLLIAGTSDPASAVGALCLFNGTAPTGSVANGAVLWAEDQAAGNSMLKTRTENGGIGFVAFSDGDTGGTGSAGAGNQYVELQIGGSIYKVLHDGTV